MIQTRWRTRAIAKVLEKPQTNYSWRKWFLTAPQYCQSDEISFPEQKRRKTSQRDA